MQARKIQVTPASQPVVEARVATSHENPAHALQALLSERFEEAYEGGVFALPNSSSVVDRFDSTVAAISRFSGVALFFVALALVAYALI